ncbi:MAG: class I SAM-dependent methyltransferase [Rhodothermales bacterium]
MDKFYNQLAPFYHLIFQDWDRSIQRQGEQLSTLIETEWPGSKNVLDVSCGIGTQAIALALQGYSVAGSDLSINAINRAKEEAANRGVDIAFSVCDMRDVHAHHGTGFDVVLSADNSIPHLLSDDELFVAISQMHGCLSIGGGCVITVRDYVAEDRGRNLVKPYGVRIENGRRYLVFQVWDFEGDFYDLTFFFIEEDLSTLEVISHTMRTRYYAVSTSRLCALMEQAGFRNVRRIDGVFYQPVLVGTRAA